VWRRSRGHLHHWWIIPLLIALPLLWIWALQPGDEGELALIYIWTYVSFIGLVASSWLVIETWKERSALGNNAKSDLVLSYIAEANFRRELFRMMKFVCLFVVGISIWLSLSSTALNRVMIVAVVALLFANTILDLRERQKTHDVLRKSLIERHDH
jgi:hypothetical protein